MISSDLDEDAKRYLEEFVQSLDEIESLILKLSDSSAKPETIKEIGRIVHSLKGTAGSYGFDLLSTACHKMEDKFISDGLVSADVFIEELLEFKDVMNNVAESYRSGNSKNLEQIKEQLGLISTNEQAPSLFIVDETFLSQGQSHELLENSPQCRVLIGENSKLLTKTIVTALLDFDVEISSASDGYEALGRFLKEKFDVFITSLNLAAIDVEDLFKILSMISNVNASVKTVVVTSSRQHADKLQRNEAVIVEKGPNLQADLQRQFAQLMDRRRVADPSKKHNFWKVMVVDDSPDVHQLIGAALKRKPHFQLIHCASSIEAESKIEFEKPDLILLDVQMPELTGDELFLRLRKNGVLKHSLVVFLTAADSQEERNKLISLGPNAILRKPFSTKSLAQHLEEILERKAA